MRMQSTMNIATNNQNNQNVVTYNQYQEEHKDCMKSPTYGYVTIEEVAKIVTDFILEDEKANFEITIGTDSQNFNMTKMVEVIAIHKVGKGGIYFYKKELIRRINNLHQKIMEETSRSIALADKFYEALELEMIERNTLIENYNVHNQIHCDIGTVGKTSGLIQEITGWVKRSGYECKIKPESYAASGVANKISK